jgi:hypothetical protein
MINLGGKSVNYSQDVMTTNCVQSESKVRNS